MLSKERLIQTFIEMVKVDSPSWEEKPMADWMLNYLKERGIEATIDNAGAAYGGNSGNIVAHIPGEPGSMPICFACHMDQIAPCHGVKPVIDGDIIRSDGTTTLGGDDKAGIASILEALEDVLESGVKHRDIYLLFTVSEETGMLGAKNFDASRLPCKDLLVIDAVDNTGVIAYKAPALEAIEVTFHGRKAHAGLEPEKGISAITVASHAISEMHLGRLDATTTANIGRIEGGDATNVVTDLVRFTAEIRAHSMERLQEEIDHMESCCKKACAEFGGTVDFVHSLSYPNFSLDLEEPVVKMTMAAMEKVGVTPKPMVIGGGSDANIVASKGYRSVILSCGMFNVHTVDEYLDTNEMWKATQINRILMGLDA